MAFSLRGYHRRMQIYLVGGAVRDGLLGHIGADRDWVVVGATPEQMIALGYAPVGKDFPVFLHPQTREEYALARTERKTAPGYKGFVVHASPEVTLEEDLARRDLTINAMAQDDQGRLIDPHGGLNDLKARVLRHVTDAFREDPVRILRLARFAARFEAFQVAPETLTLCRQMVDAGEVDALVPERVWHELSRGLMEAHAERMFVVLEDCGLLAQLFPAEHFHFEQGRPANDQTRAFVGGLRFCAREGRAVSQRFALLAGPMQQDDDAALEALLQRLRAPNECRDAARLFLRHGQRMAQVAQLDAEARLQVIEACDSFRRPERLLELIHVAQAWQAGHCGWSQPLSHTLQPWMHSLQAARSVDAKAIAQRTPAQDARPIPLRLHAARCAAIAQAMREVVSAGSSSKPHGGHRDVV